ncbi:alpha/beta hydrolase [Pedobacter panaciterrae]|uniref:alpha/beta hydrolase n=1 Tax=Pedobacter panaciterrae TaxID=363849 RepID=UPI00155D937F|nr:alpha/beta hydrolase [Pedobacter panaciterrae]NQX54047.1 alpha/beta hydrolase [Pedobacter panaciterrae]
MKTINNYFLISAKRILVLITIFLLALTGFPSFAQVKDWSTDDRISSGTKEFLKILNNGGPALESLSTDQMRLVLVNAQKAVKVDLSGVTTSEKTISSDGYKILIHIVKPIGAKPGIPVFVFTHGGGWILGDFPTHQRMVRDLVVRSGVAAVFVNYTRTPEAKYPQALNESYAVTKWVAEHGTEIGVNGKNLAIVGNSVGGNLATATALMAKAKNGPKIKLQILMWPTIDTDYNRESYQQFATDRFLTASLMKFMYDLYSTDPNVRQDIYYSPLKASTSALSGMPPTLIQVAENDILRDEGEAYGRKLDQAGVKTTTLRYDGMIHDFGLLNGLAELQQTKALFDHAALALKTYLK